MFKVIVNIGDTSKEYLLNGETKFSEIKETIKNDFNIEYRFVLVNKSVRAYRNFGKMFLELGTIQKNYEQRTVVNFLNENQELILTIEEDTKPDLPETDLSKLTNKVNNNEFIFNPMDFPPL